MDGQAPGLDCRFRQYGDKAGDRLKRDSNLVSPWPVEIFAWVSAATSGTIRSASRPGLAGALLAGNDAHRDFGFGFGVDLAYPGREGCSNIISVLPTPEKTISAAAKPALSARCISPAETISAPAPGRAEAAARRGFELTLMA